MGHYKCAKCSETFFEDEITTKQSYLGDCQGADAWESIEVCPRCGSDEFDEAYECEECHEYFTHDEMHGDYCADCLAGKMTDIPALIRIADDDDYGCDIHINGVLLDIVGMDAVGDIISREAKKQLDEHMRRYGYPINWNETDADLDDYAEMIAAYESKKRKEKAAV